MKTKKTQKHRQGPGFRLGNLDSPYSSAIEGLPTTTVSTIACRQSVVRPDLKIVSVANGACPPYRIVYNSARTSVEGSSSLDSSQGRFACIPVRAS